MLNELRTREEISLASFFYERQYLEGGMSGDKYLSGMAATPNNTRGDGEIGIT
jgi:hypothetical protein